MLIKDQLRVRMEQLDIGVPELAKRVSVSNQSVRHWLAGRSFPGKRHLPALEKALSTKLDFSEGTTLASTPTVESTLQKTDIELFLLVTQLPTDVKIHLTRAISALVQHTRQPGPVVDQTAAAAKHSPTRVARNTGAR